MIFFAGIGFGLFLYSSDRKSDLNRSWFIVSIFTAIWGLSLYGVTSTNNESLALKWQYLLDISALFIPITYFNFVCQMLGLKDIFLRRFILYLGSLIAIFSVTPYFKEGVVPKYDFFWINPGPYYGIFPIFFGFIVIVSIAFLVWGYYKNKENRLFQSQIRNTLIAAVIGFGGGITNFFPQIINIYPFGNYLVLLYVFFMGYGVLKYKLLSKKIIAAQLFSGAIFLIFLFDLLGTTTFFEWMIKFVSFLLIAFFSFFFVRSIYKEIEQREKIEKLAEELRQINVGQNSMIHFMNHQIKGRFGIAKNIFAELLSEDYGKMPEETVPLIKKGLEETDTGINYVQNILKGATAENGSLQYDKKPMNFKELVENVAKHQREKAETKGLQFNLNIEEGDYNMVGDSLQLGEAVRNLMDNSINYTLQGSISVKLNFSLNNMKLQVIDTGVGITQEDMVNLFKAGGRGANSLKINVNSTGYGLVFVKNVVEAHGGKVWVESRGEGKGSTFSVELPKLGK